MVVQFVQTSCFLDGSIDQSLQEMISVTLKLLERIHEVLPLSLRRHLLHSPALQRRRNLLPLLYSLSLQLSPAQQLLPALHSRTLHIGKDDLCVAAAIVSLAEFLEYVGETAMLLLHLLVVAPALLSLSGKDELLHGLENFVHTPHVFVEKVAGIDLEKPMISLIFLGAPVPPLHPLSQRFGVFLSLLHLFFGSRGNQSILRSRLGRVACGMAGWVRLVSGEEAGENLII